MARAPETGFYFEPVAERLALVLEGALFPTGGEWAHVGDPVEMTPDLARFFDSGAQTAIRRFVSGEDRQDYTNKISSFVDRLRQYPVKANGIEPDFAPTTSRES